jgi:hypothetical protein
MNKNNTLFALCLCLLSFYVSAQRNVAGWYSIQDYNLLGGYSYVNFLAKDSSAKLLMQNQLSNTFGLDHYLGSVYCPTDNIIDASSNPLLKIPSNSFTRMDSIGIVYGYVRNTETNKLKNNETVSDTLIITWFNHENLYTRRITLGPNSVNFSIPLPYWNKYQQLHTDYFAKDTILLTANMSTSVLNSNGGYENSWMLKSLTIKAPPNLTSDSSDHSKLFGYAIQFRSGVIGGDTGFMIYQRPPSTLPENAIRPNYFLMRYMLEQNRGDWPEMNNTTLGQISVPGRNAYPSNESTGFMSGNLYFQKRVLFDQMHLSSIVPASTYSIKTDCIHDICGAPTKGSITVTMTGGAPPYQYAINGVNYQSSNVFSDLNAGLYTVRVRDNNSVVRVAKTKIVKIKDKESGMVYGPKRVRVNEAASYFSPNTPSNFRWFVQGGIITSTPFTNTFSVTWDNQSGIGKIGLIANYSTPCADTTILEVQISPPVGLARNVQMDEIGLYPNPATQSFFLNGLDYKTYQITLSDLNGKVLLTNQISSEDVFEMNIDGLAKGCYIVMLNQGDSFKHFKLIKHE